MIRTFASSRILRWESLPPLLGCALALVTLSASPQSAPPPVPGGQQDMTLAGALARNAASIHGVVVAIGANAVPLPENAVMPDKRATLNEIARAYGKLTERFGGVTAIAPPTMTLLVSNPGAPNIYRNIPARQAFTLLAASLSDTQRQALAGENGLGQGDLTSDLQRGLFLALLPDSDFKVVPRAIPGQSTSPDVRTVSVQQIANARIRTGVGMEMAVSTVGQTIGSMTPKFGGGAAAPIYDLYSGNQLFEQDSVDGIRLRDEQPNRPKPGNLNYEASVFQKMVPLQGAKTVRDLVARIAAATGVEIYADRHFEHRAITLVADRPDARARDLLQALSFCLTGTYRRVAADAAAAFVLTDDLAGVGARRERIREIEADSDAERQKFLVEAEDVIQLKATLRNLPLSWFGNPVAVTPEQQALTNTNLLGAGSFATLKLTQDQLTASQQEALDQYAKFIHEQTVAHPQMTAGEIDLTKPVTLFLQPSIQMIVPGLDGPIDTDLGQWVSELFMDMSKFRSRYNKQLRTNATASAGPQGSLKELAGGIPHRALLAHPRTGVQVDSLVGRMKAMGLNELWINCDSADGAGMPGTSVEKARADLLAYALKATAGTDIAIYAVVDIFAWNTDASPALQDLTILGENSARSSARANRRETILRTLNDAEPPEPLDSRATLSPLSPEAEARIVARVKSLAATAGIAGLVWCGADPTGYSISRNTSRLMPYGQLGYTPTARLAFLRKAHADPLDITAAGGARELFERANVQLPLFDDYEVDQQLSDEWNTFRSDGLRACLRGLYAAAAEGAGKPDPIIFARPQRNVWGVTWYGTWDSPDAPLPVHHAPYEERAPDGNFVPVPPEDKQAKSQSRLALVRLPIASSTAEEADLVRQWGNAIKDVAAHHAWDGFVLDARE